MADLDFSQHAYGSRVSRSACAICVSHTQCDRPGDTTKGSLSCRVALDIAKDAIAGSQETPNQTVSVRGYDCYVYPSEVNCNRGETVFRTTFGAVLLLARTERQVTPFRAGPG